MTDSPEPHLTVQPWLVGRSTAGLLDFITAVFDGDELMRVPTEDGSIGHAEIRVGGSVLLAFDSRPDWPETPSMLRVFVDDVEAAFARAVEAGARVVTEIDEAAWGDRGGRIRDPFGNIWWVIQHVEDVTPDEMVRRLGEPRYVEAMATAQKTLDAELGGDGWSSRPVL